jgi:hypothetical protein
MLPPIRKRKPAGFHSVRSLSVGLLVISNWRSVIHQPLELWLGCQHSHQNLLNCQAQLRHPHSRICTAHCSGLCTHSQLAWGPQVTNDTSGTSLFFFSFIIHMCIQGLGLSPPCPHPLPYHLLHPLPLPPNPSIPSRNYFALISNFVVERV